MDKRNISIPLGVLSGAVAGLASAFMFSRSSQSSTATAISTAQPQADSVQAIVEPTNSWETRAGNGEAERPLGFPRQTDADTADVGQPRPTPSPSREEQWHETVRQHDDSIATHWQEPMDGAWARKAQSSFKDELSALQSDGHFRLENVDCRSRSCIADVRFDNYFQASTQWQRIVHARYTEPCSKEVVNDAPTDPAAPYKTTVVFDCAESRK
jgi:hypothetical protein